MTSAVFRERTPKPVVVVVGVAEGQPCSCPAFNGNIKYCMQRRPYHQPGEGGPLPSQVLEATPTAGRKVALLASVSVCLSPPLANHSPTEA